MKTENIKFDCKYFKAYIPCKPNKLKNVSCDNCVDYKAFTKKILIIKLGAIGDVIRTTPLVTKYRELYPDCKITWLTLFPDVLPENKIDEIYKIDAISLYILANERFDIAINLDKEKEVCILLAGINAEKKYGFTWRNNHIDAENNFAEHKFLTGMFDGISKINTKNYLEEIFEICDLKFNNEEYLIKTNIEFQKKWKNKISILGKGKKIIGLNTGCGKRWLTRLWPSEYWIELIKELQKINYFPVLLGGEIEDKKNKFYSEKTGAYYPGHFSLEEFISLSSSCDIIVTQVSMMMHIATALKKQLILFNNIFNKNEFYLYGRGVIIEPDSGCDCYYGNFCKREKNCMYDLPVAKVIDKIEVLKF